MTQLYCKDQGDSIQWSPGEKTLDAPLAVELRGLVKQFGSVMANDHVDFSVRQGEIHALLGENGAGKSTVMCMLSGVYRPTSGDILIHGEPAKIHSPKDAVKLGIGMVFQNFRLVPTLTAAENIVLGETSSLWRTRGWMTRKTAEIEALAQHVGLPFVASRPVWQLSVGEQQRVEIVKTLYRGANLVILDEPTSVLTPGEADQLFSTLRQLKDEGKTVILTTHKLKEVMAIADRISVMRKGKMVATLDKGATDEREVARLMVGQDRQEPRTRSARQPGAAVLTLDKLTVTADHGRHALDELSFSVHEGEIVGIAGVAGNGQKELAEVLAGLRTWSSGTLSFRDTAWKTASVRHSIASGIAHIPENRMKSGLAGSLGTVDNLLVKSYRTRERSRWGFLRSALNRLWSQKLVEQFDVKTAHIDAPVHQMSGGNQQKLLFAREIHQQPHLMVAVHPTQGLDVGATDGVHNLLMNLRDEGRSVLLISEDLDELLLLSDRIIVLFAGKVMGEVTHDNADREHLGLWMAGVAVPGEVS
jgi:simple sugar transport system ATP-binding protein